MKRSTCTLCALAPLLLAAHVQAAPFTTFVASDAYDSTPDGTPTARGDNDGIPDLHDAATILTGISYTANEQLDPLFVSADEVWTQTASSADVALIGLTAANINAFGFYTDPGAGTDRTTLIQDASGFGFFGDGLAPETAYVANTFSTDGPFGWFLETRTSSTGPVTSYFSEADLNAGGWDHMMTFDLSELISGFLYWVDPDTTVDGNERRLQIGDWAYLVGWEDLPVTTSADGSTRLGDDDYDDMMFLVADVRPARVPEPGTVAAVGLGLGLLSVQALRRRARS